MAPPVKAMVNALKHCGGFTPPNLDAIWTRQGCRSLIFERSSPMPERLGDFILSSRHRHGTAIPKAPAHMRMERKSNMTVPRKTPYVWTTWITKLLAQEHHCVWASWFQANHQQYDKVPSDLEQ